MRNNKKHIEPNTVVYSLVVFTMLFSYAIVATTIAFVMNVANYNGVKLTESSFFTASSTDFYLLGIHFKDPYTFYVLNLVFFSNSLFLNINIFIVQPLFQKVLFSNNPAIEHTIKLGLSVLVVIYDIWTALRSVISLIGVTSNFTFFLSNSIGFLLGDTFIKYLYLTYPERVNFKYERFPITVTINNNISPEETVQKMQIAPVVASSRFDRFPHSFF